MQGCHELPDTQNHLQAPQNRLQASRYDSKPPVFCLHVALGAEWQKLWKVARGMELVLQGSEVILRIGRLRRSFRDAHGGSAPPP